jgi:Ca-activated chloride channel family protein
MTELTLKVDRRLSSERGRDMHFVMLRFRAPLLVRTNDRPGLNLSLVLDRSGSMSGGKIGLAKRAIAGALSRLTPKDRFSLIAYNHDVETVVPSMSATPEGLRDARLATDGILAGGNTALFDGYVRGAQQVAEHLAERDLGKVMLVTDGLANVGLVDPAAIAQHVAELRARGVLTSTFGIGADFNQVLLESMADAGGGNFYFVEDAVQLEDLLTGEVGEALETVAREVRVIAEHDPDIQLRLLDAFKVESEGNGWVSRLGPLTSEQIVELLYEVDLPGRKVGAKSTLSFTVRDADGTLGSPVAVVEFVHATHAEVEAEEADAEVVRRAAQRIRQRASEHAFAMNYEGRRGEVRQEAGKVLEYLKKLAIKNPEVANVIAELEEDVAKAGEIMSVMALKMAYYDSSRARRGRDSEGKAIKDPGPSTKS